MKRYFDVIGKKLTVELDVTVEGEKLTPEQISLILNCPLREIKRMEYDVLNKYYEN